MAIRNNFVEASCCVKACLAHLPRLAVWIMRMNFGNQFVSRRRCFSEVFGGRNWRRGIVVPHQQMQQNQHFIGYAKLQLVPSKRTNVDRRHFCPLKAKVTRSNRVGRANFDHSRTKLGTDRAVCFAAILLQKSAYRRRGTLMPFFAAVAFHPRDCAGD